MPDPPPARSTVGGRGPAEGRRCVEIEAIAARGRLSACLDVSEGCGPSLTPRTGRPYDAPPIPMTAHRRAGDDGDAAATPATCPRAAPS